MTSLFLYAHLLIMGIIKLYELERKLVWIDIV